MIFQEKQITLRDGRTALLKTPELPDAAKMLSYIKTACGETDFLARYPEEWEGTTIEQEEGVITHWRTSPDTLAITCYIDGHVAGNCSITFRRGLKTAHRATVAIAILKKYWNLGIGSTFFEEMIAAAISHGSEIIELEYIEGNERGRHLYEKFGFSVVSCKPKAFKCKDGSYRDEYYMQKYL